MCPVVCSGCLHHPTDQQVSPAGNIAITASSTGAGAAAAYPITPMATRPGVSTPGSAGPAEAAAAELLQSSPGQAVAGLQAQGKTYLDVVMMYTDMVRAGLQEGRSQGLGFGGVCNVEGKGYQSATLGRLLGCGK